MRKTNRHSSSALIRCSVIILVLIFLTRDVFPCAAQSPPPGRTISGVIVGPQNEVLNGVTVVIRGTGVERVTATTGQGQYSLEASDEQITLHIDVQYIKVQMQ